MSNFEKVTQEELEQLREKWNALHESKQRIAENEIVISRCNEQKQGLFFNYTKAESEYIESQNTLSKKYGENISIDLKEGVITYK